MRWMLLCYVIICFLVAGGLLFKKSVTTAGFLGLFAFLFGLEIADFLYGTSQLKVLYPSFFGWYYLPAGFLYGPLLFWHFKNYLNPSYRWTAGEWAHLIPFGIVMLYLLNTFPLSGNERIAYISEHFISMIMPVNYARALHLLIYGLILIFYVYQRQHRLSPKIKLYSWSIILIYFLSCVVSSWFTEFADSWRDFDLYYFIACNIILLIGILLYTDPAFLNVWVQKYLKSAIPQKDRQRIEEKLKRAFSEEQLFTRSDLSLSLLSELIDEQKHHISQTLSYEMEEHFHSFVNRHRVAHAKSLLIHPDYQNLTIAAIGEESGFNNKVSFYKAFKQNTSLTPSAYRKTQMQRE